MECPAADGEPLLRVPTTAMLPIQRVDWASGADVLRVTGISDWPHEADLPLLYTQVGLHNACGKLPRLVAMHPSASQTLSTETIAAVRVLRPSFRIRTLSPTDVFWATRAFRLPAFDGESQPVVLPVLDALNHHPRGAVGQWHGDSFTVSVSRPTGTTECYLDYGHQRDALETALVYGFLDTASTLAHSPPLSVTSPDIATVTVLDEGRGLAGDVLPLTARYHQGTWLLNRFTLGIDDASALAGATGQPMDWCEHVVSALARASINALDDLDATLTAIRTDPAQALLAAASGLRGHFRPDGTRHGSLPGHPVISDSHARGAHPGSVVLLEGGFLSVTVLVIRLMLRAGARWLLSGPDPQRTG